ncbi:hypothetical protein [Clostridioides difficile]|uniref:hypothetical protein n=1 Tax=Clostridioides difficile TaxID=1496 RepID=UPI003B517B79
MEYLGTPLVKIYKKFLDAINDEEMLLLSNEIIEKMMYSYLEDAIVDFNQCKKDLTIKYVNEKGEEIIPAAQLSYTSNYSNKNAEITLMGKDTKEEYELDKDYTISFEDEKFIISFVVETTEEIIFKYKYLGEIVSDLDLEEIKILSYGMQIHWLQPKINREENLKQMLTDSDYNAKSGANMLAKLQAREEQLRTRFNKYQQRYMLKNFEGWN